MKVKPATAALLNAFSSHSLEFDDVHMGGIIHPGAVVNPSALALAEDLKASGKSLITSIVAGYETCIRVAKAVGREHYKLWHTTGTCGVFDASASKILNLDSLKISRALGIAGVLTSGLWEYITVGSSMKPLIPAHAAWLRVISSILSSQDMSAPLTIFEGSRGFLKGLAPKTDPKAITEDLNSFDFKCIN